MAKKNKKKNPIRSFLVKLFLFTSLLGLIIAIIAGCMLYSYIKPFHERAQEYELTRIDEVEHPSIIFDRNGNEIGRMYVENRSVISIDQMPERLVNCLIAQEDQRFWEHKGVDWTGLMRMLYLNAKAGKVTQGASTVTMQLARNAFNLKAEALKREEGGKERKLVEICLAHRIGSKYASEAGKKYILENYLNRVPFGHGYYGVRSAALGYFGKEPADLEWEEAASMVACIKNPSAFSPLRRPKSNKKARDHVFRRLLEDGYISEAQFTSFIKRPIQTNPNPLKRGTSHLYEKVGNLSREIVGEEAMSIGGYRIYTTIDLQAQRDAERALKQQLLALESTPDYNHPKYADYSPKQGPPTYLQGGVFVHNPKNGEVLAYVGGRDYNHTQFDFVELGRRPIGTGILPFLYAYAVDEGYTPATMLLDEPMDNRLVMVGGREGILGEWGQESLEPRYEGEVSLRAALESSKIAASVRLGKALGIGKLAEYCQAFGINFPEEEDLLTRDLLGSVPMSLAEAGRAYSTFANNGSMPDEYSYIKRIESSDGVLVYFSNDESLRSNVTKVVDSATAYQVDDILRGVTSRGNLSDRSQSLLLNGFEGGAKTGTPYNFSDAWAFAYNSHFVCSSWVGFQRGSRRAIVSNGFAKEVAWPVVQKTVAQMDASLRLDEVTMPNGVEEVDVCSHSGLIATRYCFAENDSVEGGYLSTTIKECFKSTHAPQKMCSLHMGLKGKKSFVDRYAPDKGETAARPTLALDTVMPSSSAVVGADPYGAMESSEKDEEERALTGAYSSGILFLNDSVVGQDDAEIKLPRPRKLQLKVVPEDLKPIVPRAIIVD